MKTPHIRHCKVYAAIYCNLHRLYKVINMRIDIPTLSAWEKTQLTQIYYIVIDYKEEIQIQSIMYYEITFGIEENVIF